MAVDVAAVEEDEFHQEGSGVSYLAGEYSGEVCVKGKVCQDSSSPPL